MDSNLASRIYRSFDMPLSFETNNAIQYLETSSRLIFSINTLSKHARLTLEEERSRKTEVELNEARNEVLNFLSSLARALKEMERNKDVTNVDNERAFRDIAHRFMPERYTNQLPELLTKCRLTSVETKLQVESKEELSDLIILLDDLRSLVEEIRSVPSAFAGII